MAKRSGTTEQDSGAPADGMSNGDDLKRVTPPAPAGYSRGSNGQGRRTGSAGANGPTAVHTDRTARVSTPDGGTESGTTPAATATTAAPSVAPEPHGDPAQGEVAPVTTHPARFGPVALVLVEMLLDIIGITAAFVLAYWLRFNSDIYRQYSEPDTATYATMLGVTVATMIVTFYFSKLYSIKRGASRVDEFYKIAAAISIGTVLSLALNSFILGDRFVYSRLVPPIGVFFAIVFVTALRLLYSWVVGELRKHGVGRARVLVIGTGPTAYTVASRLEWHRTLGYKVAGLVESSLEEVPPGRTIGKLPVLGNLNDLVDLVRREQVDEVIVALQGASDVDLRSILGRIKDENVSVKIYPDALQLMTQYDVSVGELSGMPLLSVRDVALRGWNRRLKRTFDILFSSVVLILTAPFFLLIALAVKVSSPGPVFFIQERVGLDNKPFRLVKFRSMRIDANPSGWTTANDPRRTAIGTFIRRFSLDELPQFFNVLLGEMSVVGPRPEQPEYVKQFAERISQAIGEDYLRRHREKAGITGWAQVNGFRGDSSIEVRTQLDLYYVENWSILFDLKIILRTVVAMFKGKNAY